PSVSYGAFRNPSILASLWPRANRFSLPRLSSRHPRIERRGDDRANHVEPTGRLSRYACWPDRTFGFGILDQRQWGEKEGGTACRCLTTRDSGRYQRGTRSSP